MPVIRIVEKAKGGFYEGSDQLSVPRFIGWYC